MPTIARFEREIAEISFSGEAMDNDEFYRRKVDKAMARDREGMLVLDQDGVVGGWLWMAIRTNFINKKPYADFKSLYVTEELRGTPWPGELMEAGMQVARSHGTNKIIGRVHASNLPMRLLYKKFGFAPVHITMEYRGG